MPTSPISIYRPDNCDPGYTLYCHTYESADQGRDGFAHIYLIDMAGTPAHEWRVATAAQLPELLPNGDLVYMTRDRSNLDTAGVYKLAPDSSVLWSYHCRVDHDFHVMDNGDLMIHTITDRMTPRLGNELRRHPYFIQVRPDKSLAWEWHGEDHLDELADLVGLEIPIDFEARLADELAERLTWDPRVSGLTITEQADAPARTTHARAFDWAHNNTCDVLCENASGAQDPRFRAGNILFSYRSLDIIGIIDRDTSDVIWAWGPDVLDGQHQPTMLPNGHILVYDNGARRGWSAVRELDPLTGEIVWEYTGTPKRAFYAGFISGMQRLANGNTLICEGSSGTRPNGRLFEVTPDKTIVWEYRSPFMDPGTFGIYRCVRYTPDYVTPLLNRAS